MGKHVRRDDRREYRAEVFDGLGTANVYIVDGYDRHVDAEGGNRLGIYRAVGVHTAAEAIAQAKADGFRPRGSRLMTTYPDGFRPRRTV